MLLPGDVAEAAHCQQVVAATVHELGGLDLLVNSVAFQQPVDDLVDLDDEQWLRTFDVNMHSFYRVTKAGVPHLLPGSAIVNTA